MRRLFGDSPEQQFIAAVVGTAENPKSNDEKGRSFLQAFGKYSEQAILLRNNTDRHVQEAFLQAVKVAANNPRHVTPEGREKLINIFCSGRSKKGAVIGANLGSEFEAEARKVLSTKEVTPSLTK